jgi:trimethylamine--corrinoid protein Co-methyltransferase
MLVIDNEIAEMLKRVKRGLEFSQENLALDVIAQAGPAGMFIDKPHTLERMKTCAVLPHIANRDPRRTWEENGSLDAQGQAMQRVREILTRDNPAIFSPEVDARIRAEFAGLVAGDSTPPPGWTPPQPTRARRRANRRQAR